MTRDETDESTGGDHRDTPGGGGAPAGHPGSDDLGLIGTTVSHYRIEACLGRGGMGVVYRASDFDLDRTVALKFLPALLGDEPRAIDRFIAEARAASALDHPNICTIYEIGRDASGRIFIAMAYYRGETLKEKIERRPLPLDEALEYARQLAGGLAKAHAAGIVHRDIKPANIIVTPDGVAKILDFGLAKVEDQQLTRTGELLGTLDYMSPEQVEGTRVDGRTDVWSLGAMLYEMLTGERPFPASNQAALLYAVMHAPSPSLRDTELDLPGWLIDVVDRCLEKDPADRYADAGALLHALEARGGAATTPGEAVRVRGIPAAAEPRTAGRERRRPLRRRGWLFAAVAVALGALLLALPVTRRAITGASPAGAVAGRAALVAIIPSESGLPEDRLLSEGLTHQLAGELTRLGGEDDSLWVLPATEILNMADRTARAVHRLHGVDRILTVAVKRLGDAAGDPSVSLGLVDPSQAFRMVREVDLPYPAGTGFAAFRARLPGALADLFGFRAPEATAASTGTANPQAFDYYSSGLGYLSRRNDLDNLEYAEGQFLLALEEDPGYARAHAGLCETRFERFRVTNDTAFANRAVESCERAIELGSDLPEVLVPVASSYLQTGETRRARQTLEEALAIAPRNADAHRWMARVWEQLGDYERAWEEFGRAIALNPRVWVYRSDYAASLMYRGRHEEALPQYQEIRRLAPDNIFGDIGLSFVYLQLDNIEEAKELLAPLVEARAHARAFSNLGYAYLQEGRYEEAEQVLEEGARVFPGDMWISRWIGEVRELLGRPDAEEAWNEVIAIGQRMLDVDREDEDALDALAEAYARIDEPGEAETRLQRLVAEPGLYDYHVYHIGRTYELLGRRELALRWLETAVRDYGYPLHVVTNDPWLAELRRDTGFEAIRDVAGQ